MSWFTERRDAIRNKARAIIKKVTDLKPRTSEALGASFNLGLSADIDVAIKAILDDSFLRVIDRAVVALDSTIDKSSQEFQQLVQQVFDNLSELEKQIEQLIDRFFQNISNAIQDVRRNLVEPLIATIYDLENKLFEDINQVVDKVFNYFDGKTEEFKQDLLKIFGWISLPNPLDPCRQKYQLGLTPGSQLTYIDVFNLFECHQLKRLDDSPTTVREIQEIYAILQLQSFKMTCLGRGSPSFQKLYMQKWLDYGQLFEMWKEFDDTMTPQEAYNEALKKLNQARDEYQARVTDITIAQQTANTAQGTAQQALNQANQAQAIATNALSGQLQGLDVATQFSSIVRVADFNLGGYPGRRGQPGRALVDAGGTLGINWESDWGETLIHSQLKVTGEIKGKLWFSDEFMLDVPSNGSVAATKMLPADKCFAFITSVSGSFQGGGERVWVEMRGDGYWYLCGHGLQPQIQVKARCAGMP